MVQPQIVTDTIKDTTPPLFRQNHWHSKSFKMKVSVATQSPQKPKTEVLTANHKLKQSYDLVDLMTLIAL